MGLFNFRKKKNRPDFPITDPDKGWVIENLTWLVQVYGIPHPEDRAVMFSGEFFPQSTRGEGEIVDNLIADLKSILGLQSLKITYVVQEDLRDIKDLPYEIEGKPFQSGLVVAKEQYHIILAKSLLKYDKALLSSLIYEFVKIRLEYDQYEYDTGEDADLFLYLGGVYFGFGPLLYQGLVNTGRTSDGNWETRWSFIADLPEEVMAYALALYVDLIGDRGMVWKGDLSTKLESLLDAAIEYHKHNNVSLIMKGEAEAEELFEAGSQLFQDFDWEQATEIFRRAIFLETSNPLKADIYNNLGYCHMRMGDYEGSLTNFQIAVDLNRHAYAFSNMAYVMILGGRPDAAKPIIEIILEVNDLPGYAHRNTAMYHQALGDTALAEEHFQKAMAVGAPVDLLEFHYSEFLFEQGKKDEAMVYLKKAVDKGEPEAVVQYQAFGY
ncbi:MAG: tetratricopeptide repeat protein [Roseivirga sp.]|nr:tetratricopeptide repeat protein [Roseivirga sp.]